MKSIIHILSKNPDLCECKTRLKNFLSNDERVYLSKTMLRMICSEMNARLTLVSSIRGGMSWEPSTLSRKTTGLGSLTNWYPHLANP